jgi:ABC-type glycerol-3-phosphate transport system permease component
MKIKKLIKSSWKRFAKFSFAAKIVLILYFALFVIEAFIHLLPVFFVVNNAFKNTYNPLNSLTIQPELFTVRNFLNVFTKFKWAGVDYFGMFVNSLWATSLYIFVNVASSTMLAYALARFRFPGRNFLYGIVIFIQTVPVMGAGAADFQLRSSLGMVNNPALLWISWAMGFDYTCFILYGIFQGISRSYSESAKIEGATFSQVLLQIMLPQAMPAILAMCVTNFTTRWNDYTTFQIYLNKYPNLAFGLFQFANSGSNTSAFAGGKLTYYAALLCAALPVVVVYASSQTLILKNIAVGGLKG